MNMKKILIPTDFSHTNEAALELAASLARDMQAKLLIVHVEEAPLAYGGEMYYGMPEPMTQDLGKMLAEVRPNDLTVPYEHHLLLGDPAVEIVQFADKEAVDMIVMGTHGRTGVARMLMGSVTESVVRHAQ